MEKTTITAVERKMTKHCGHQAIHIDESAFDSMI
jgi:hypothetical protein